MPDSKTYTVPAHCTNCDHDFEAQVPFGQPVPTQIGCPRCGCMAARRREKPARMYPAAIPDWTRPQRRFEPRCIGVYHNPAWMANHLTRQTV